MIWRYKTFLMFYLACNNCILPGHGIVLGFSFRQISDTYYVIGHKLYVSAPSFALAPKDSCIIRWHNDFPIIMFGSLILRNRRGQISQTLQSRPFQLATNYWYLLPIGDEFHLYSMLRGMTWTCVKELTLLKTNGVGKPHHRARFSWPIIKTLLKYQCPARNERASPQKWATDIKDIWGCSCFYNSVKETESRGNVI